LSEHPLTFIEMLRRIVDHEISAEEEAQDQTAAGFGR
jgi:hypothetical protein